MSGAAEAPASAALLLPNLGAEEGRAEREPPGARPAPVRAAAALWEALFRPPDAPAFAWLAAPGAAVAWMNTEAAARAAAEAGLPLAGPAPAAVRRVHDKAFAQRAAEARGLVPEPLRGLARAFEPDELRDAGAAEAAMRAHARALPAWVAGALVKPRLGTSGRGRVRLGPDGGGGEALRAALPRLAERGGALLEPELERTADLSVQLHLPAQPGAPPTLLGTLALRVTRRGLPTAHRGLVDARGRVDSGDREDAALREAAVAVAEAARAEGLSGPCGVDALRFRGPEGREWLRPVVEVNARFTLGTVALGHLRRALPALRERLGLAPGAPRPFHLGLAPPRGGWPAEDAGGGLCVIALGGAEAREGGPALVAARTPDALEAALGP